MDDNSIASDMGMNIHLSHGDDDIKEAMTEFGCERDNGERWEEVRGNIHWEEEDTVQGTIVNREPTLSFSFEESYHRVVSKQPLGQPKEDF